MVASPDPIPFRKKPGPPPDAQTVALPNVKPAGFAPRHRGIMAMFVLLFVLPVVTAAWYLWARAADRYVSVVGFSVRAEQSASALEFLGGVAELPSSSGSDAEILAQFITSPGLVAKADAVLNLRTMWSKPGYDWRHPRSDPVFAYHPPGQIEDLEKYWNRRVKVDIDTGSGLLSVSADAFTPQDAHALTTLIFHESAEIINRLSETAREDATRYARVELDRAKADLRQVREDVTTFRNRTQIVDPEASIQGQMGLLSSLQSQLAQTLIDLDVLRQSARPADPRIRQAEGRVEVIEQRISELKAQLGLGPAPGQQDATAFAHLIGEYEGLMVDLHFAEETYAAARAAFDAALSDAQRQSRYLAAHIDPTEPEAALRPHRWGILALTAFFAAMVWSVAVLILYAFRDRR